MDIYIGTQSHVQRCVHIIVVDYNTRIDLRWMDEPIHVHTYVMSQAYGQCTMEYICCSRHQTIHLCIVHICLYSYRTQHNKTLHIVLKDVYMNGSAKISHVCMLVIHSTKYTVCTALQSNHLHTVCSLLLGSSPGGVPGKLDNGSHVFTYYHIYLFHCRYI